MTRVTGRIEKLEEAAGFVAPVVVVWCENDEPEADAIAIHEAKNGPIPDNACPVIFVRYVCSSWAD